MNNLHPFDITFRKGESVFTWIRFAPHAQAARTEAQKVLDREYNGRAELIRVSPHEKTWNVQTLEKDHDGYAGWDIFCVRDSLTNCHVATVGAVDRRDSERYQEFAFVMAAAPRLYRALELCYTRLFNYQVGMDEIREPKATKELNAEALDAAKSALDAAKVPGSRSILVTEWTRELVEAVKRGEENAGESALILDYNG